MPTLYIISRDDCSLYYHSLTPRGYPLWTAQKEQAQLLTQEEASRISDYLNYTLAGMNEDCTYQLEIYDES